MLNGRQKVILPHFCRLIDAQFEGDLSDRALLERFLGQCDSAAFAALVRRHGPTVLGVCRRVLHNAHDAEDAFQATFLVLVRKGRSIAKREALGSWLYGVAYRLALKAQADIVRRRQHERQAANRFEASAKHEPTGDDLRPILDEEVNRLPDKYRRPIVLCYFEGKTYQEAARLLGWPAGTTSVRLARARELLRTRLALRGLALSAAALVVGLTEGTASAADVGLLAEATARTALRFAADPTAAGVSTQVIALTEGMVKAMLLQKVKTLAGVFLAVGIGCAAAGGLWHSAMTTAPVAAAERPSAPARAGTGPAGGEVFVAADRPGAAEDPRTPPSSTADPLGPVQETPAGPPPRALATPAKEGAPPLQTRIGLFNMTRVLKAAKKFQAVQADLLTRVQQAQKKLEVLKTNVEKLKVESEDPATPAARREEFARQIRQIQREMEDEQESARKAMDKTSGEAVRSMYREVEDAANKIAKAKGLELVLFYTDAVTEADFYNPNNLQRKLSQSGALMPMIVAPGMDITDTVIEALDLMVVPAEGPRR
jgi:RNA polymerase sigma factor (sigma-70 family)